VAEHDALLKGSLGEKRPPLIRPAGVHPCPFT
jgi:hypothetical protein